MTHLPIPFSLVQSFPDFSVPGFDIEAYNSFFKTSNSIIHARASDIAYPEHWGCFSVKCAFDGEEYYQVQNRKYAVNDHNFLLLNEGRYYSSYIFSKKQVESFTLNFTRNFVQQSSRSLLCSAEQMADNPFHDDSSNPEFVEKLYEHNNTVSPVIFKIKELAKNFNSNKESISELSYLLMERLLLLHHDINLEIDSITACKPSTRKELYRRLHYAKDYMDSCYAADISLEDLSRIALLNTAYFLRQFRKYFHATPYQYLVRRRIRVAAEMIKNTRLPVADICNAVGYQDASSFSKLFKKYYGACPEKYRGQPA